MTEPYLGDDLHRRRRAVEAGDPFAALDEALGPTFYEIPFSTALEAWREREKVYAAVRAAIKFLDPNMSLTTHTPESCVLTFHGKHEAFDSPAAVAREYRHALLYAHDAERAPVRRQALAAAVLALAKALNDEYAFRILCADRCRCSC